MNSFLKTQLLGGCIVAVTWILVADTAMNHLGDAAILLFIYGFSQMGISLMRNGVATQNHGVSYTGYVTTLLWYAILTMIMFSPGREITRIFDDDMLRTSAFMSGIVVSFIIVMVQIVLINVEAAKAPSAR